MIPSSKFKVFCGAAVMMAGMGLGCGLRMIGRLEGE